MLGFARKTHVHILEERIKRLSYDLSDHLAKYRHEEWSYPMFVAPRPNDNIKALEAQIAALTDRIEQLEPQARFPEDV